MDECYEANAGKEITYFEITTCAAILAMSRNDADYTLLEVGLGGRLDATNVIENPKLAVITPISFDHEQFLGNTIEKIAWEKAGIIKENKPVISKDDVIKQMTYETMKDAKSSKDDLGIDEYPYEEN